MGKENEHGKRCLIRNSTAEFLIFTAQNGGEGIEVRYEDETIWLTQKLMAALFDVTVPTISEHLANVYEQAELDREATIRKFRTVQTEGSREVARTAAELIMQRADGKKSNMGLTTWENAPRGKDRLFESDFDREVKRLEGK
jgi:hypothetical protein